MLSCAIVDWKCILFYSIVQALIAKNLLLNSEVILDFFFSCNVEAVRNYVILEVQLNDFP